MPALVEGIQRASAEAEHRTCKVVWVVVMAVLMRLSERIAYVALRSGAGSGLGSDPDPGATEQEGHVTYAGPAVYLGHLGDEVAAGADGAWSHLPLRCEV